MSKEHCNKLWRRAGKALLLAACAILAAPSSEAHALSAGCLSIQQGIQPAQGFAAGERVFTQMGTGTGSTVIKLNSNVVATSNGEKVYYTFTTASPTALIAFDPVGSVTAYSWGCEGLVNLSFTGPGDQLLSAGSVTLQATSNTPNLTTTFTATPANVCSVTGSTLRLLAEGQCTITASVAGSHVYAAPISVTISIRKSLPVGALTKAISQQSGQRVQSIMANNLGSNRQIDRLMDQGGSGTGTPGALAPGFTADEKRALDVATSGMSPSRLGLGLNGTSATAALSQSLGLRSTYDDDLTSPMRQRGPGYGTQNGGGISVAGMNVMGSDDASMMNFSTSLRDVARAVQQDEQQRLKDDPTAAAMGFTAGHGKALDKRTNPLDIWVEGRFLRLNDGRNGADLTGHSGLFGTGVDYVFNRSLLAGVSLSFDVNAQKSSAAGIESRGTGWLAGPYATVRLSDNVYWQSRAAWGRASNDITQATGTDSFASSRWLANTRLTGRYQSGPWQLRPTAGVAYMEETSDDFVNATGASVQSVKTRVGTASAGPEISYQMRVNSNVLIEPRVGSEVIWTFVRDVSVGGSSALVAADAAGPGGLRGRVEIGLRTLMTGGIVVDLSGAYDGIGAGDYNSVTGRGVVRMPLN